MITAGSGPVLVGRGLSWSLISAGLLLACEGVIGQPAGRVNAPGAGDGDGEVDCSVLQVGNTPLRRLSRAEYDRTVRDLLGVEGNPSSGLAPDERIGPFTSNAIAPITDLLVQQHMEAAESIAAQVAPNLEALMPCTLGSDGCATRFIAELGRRAYRRPLTAEEAARYETLHAQGRSVGDERSALRLVVAAMLQSPNFLYHVEIGDGSAADGEPVPLTSYELAARLSYFLWGSMPDDELLDAAEAGLGDPERLRAQAERLLDDPRAREAIGSFHLQWLGLESLDTIDKDGAMFPGFDDAMRQALQDETVRFADHVIREGDGRLETLLTASWSMLDDPLFGLYGVERPADFDPAEPVALDPTERAGLLTQAGVLAAHAHRNQSSPVHRGILVRENFLCQPLPPPPPNVNNTPPEPTPGQTTRQRFAAHRDREECASCHTLIDGIGLGFEHYDAIGAFRETDADLPIDATGDIVGAAEIDGAFDGAVELAGMLADSDLVRQCVGRQWFRFALGRMESNADECSRRDIQQAFEDSGGDVRELMLAIATSDTFRHTRVAVEEAAP